jgi:hypothetical protein
MRSIISTKKVELGKDSTKKVELGLKSTKKDYPVRKERL